MHRLPREQVRAHFFLNATFFRGGAHCEICKENSFPSPIKDAQGRQECVMCDCNPDGSENLQCREDNMSRCQFGDKCMAGICDPALGRNCEPCNSRNPSDCDNGQAACLLYSLDDPDFPHSGACGEYCERPSDCPWGFNCNAVSVVDSNRQCQTGADCGAAPCQRGEGATHGYCGCANDGDEAWAGGVPNVG